MYPTSGKICFISEKLLWKQTCFIDWWSGWSVYEHELPVQNVSNEKKKQWLREWTAGKSNVKKTILNIKACHVQ